MKTYIALCFVFVLSMSMDMNSQGCVATRGMSSCGGSNTMGMGINLSPGEWNFVTGFRYFESFR
ncbi:MAG: transporter, partial [Candidatus Kapaibacteriota bacterium]